MEDNTQSVTQDELQPGTTTPSGEAVKVVKCLNCGTEFVGKFCPECGQRADTGRFTMRFIYENLMAAFTNRDGSIWLTLKNLFTRPGAMIVEILNGKRRSYFSPFPMLFFTLTVYILLAATTGSRSEFNEAEINYLGHEKTEEAETADAEEMRKTAMADFLQNIAGKSLKFYNNHYTAIQMLTLPLLVFAARACYGKHNRKRYNRAEYAVALAYTMVMVVLYRCIVSLVYLISPDISDDMGFFHPIALVVAFTACFHKMMGFRLRKTIKRSVLAVALYYMELVVLFGIATTILIVILYKRYYS